MSDGDKRSGSKPTHVVLLYDDSDYPARVGVAWPLKGKKGLSIKLHGGVSIATPKGTRLVIMRDDGGKQKRGGDDG